MSSLAEFAILNGADNRPPMLDKLILSPEWSKFVTDVKLVKDLHVTNFDHLFAHLECHEAHANEIRILKERSHDPLALIANHQHNTYQTAAYNNPQQQSSLSQTYTLGASGSNSEKQRTVICYNCKGECHMSKQCTKPKRKRDDSWFKDKVLLVQAQANGQILHEEELAFLADLGIPKVALMANLSHYGSDAHAEVQNPDNVDNNMINQAVQNSINSPKPTLSSRPTKVEVPNELPKVSMVNTSLKKHKHHLAGLDVVVKEEPRPQLSLRARKGSNIQ
nr:hypothetical protein [Tanacetum cinerariifolium]